jgi:hypothetical protein
MDLNNSLSALCPAKIITYEFENEPQSELRVDKTIADIFVSYTSTDSDWAFWIGDELEALGHTPRIHDWELADGRDIIKWMEERHHDADHVLCVFSRAYLNKAYSTLERRGAPWAALTERPNFLLPVLVEPCEVPTLFAPLKRCDLYGLAEVDARARLRAFLAPLARRRSAFPDGKAKSSPLPASRRPSAFPGGRSPAADVKGAPMAPEKGNIRGLATEAAADSLIAAFAGRSTRGKIAVPTRPPAELSDADLQAQASVVLEAGAPTYADLLLTAAPVALIETFEAVDVSSRIAYFDEFDVRALRVAETPWLGGRLAILPHRERKIEVPFFVGDSTIALAGRTNEWIYGAMRKRQAPQIDANLLAYARFFFTTVVGQLGAFKIADRLDDAIWLPDAPTDRKQELSDKLTMLRFIGNAEDGRSELRGTVIFKNALFITSIMIAPDWQLELANEELLMEELPIEFGQKVDLLVRR